MSNDEKAGRIRIDKWLWHARFYKTRNLAQDAAESGRVRLNGQRIEKAGRGVKLGDVLTIPAGREVLVVRVVAFGLRRGPAPEAQALYEIVAEPELREGGLDPKGSAPI